MLSFHSYFDETGDEADPNVFFCGFGGVINDTSAWNPLEEKWLRILGDYGLEWFHSAEFFNFQGKWAATEWKDDRERCQELYRRLWKAIHQAQPIPVGCLIPLKPYREKLTAEQRKSLINVYFLAYITIMGIAWTALGDHRVALNVERIATIFDDKKGFQGHANAFYDIVTSKLRLIREKTTRPKFCDWRKTIPLQIADIVAYEAHREYRRRMFTPNKHKRYGWTQLEQLNRNLGFGSGQLGDEQSRIIFRPESYVDELADIDNWEEVSIDEWLK